ncbi:MAG: glycoside hydrolase family 3 C-terminal domain-containing protein [Terriglobales bacterium]
MPHQPGRISITCVWLILLVTLGSSAAQTAKSAGTPLYLDPSQPVNVRVDDLVSRMTLEEKASQLVNQSRAVPRLQIPEYDWWSEALHGVARAGTATVFPEPIGLAATFDPPLIHQMATAIGQEARAKHNQAVRAGRRDIYEGLDFWSPNINIFRDPRWGRGQETYGEDPFLTARMGVAFVTGMQGDDPKYLQVIATPKHFAVHSGPETTRHMVNVDATKHDMEDTYLPAFRATVTEGKARSVMCAYNRINGEPACANAFLLEDMLRGAWKFKGYVVSDCDAVADIERGHHFTQTMAEAAAISLKRGTDNECADFGQKAVDNSDYVKYIDAVKQGLLSEKDVDVALKRLFTARFELGMFDPPEMVKYAQTPESVIDSEAHRQLALKTARESIVLLKNDGTLPLKASARKIAVVGPLADSLHVLEGNYNGTPSRATTALEGIRKQFTNAAVTFTPGTSFLLEYGAVPASSLFTPDGKSGLKAEYFKDPAFHGAPAKVQVDKDVNFAFAPGTTSKTDIFAVRWTGFLTPAASGTYHLGLDGSLDRLWLDGKMIVDDPKSHDSRPMVAEVALEKGHRYPLKIEYFQGRARGVKLVWRELSPDPIGDAVAAAKQADVVVAVVGITSDLEGEEMDVAVPGFAGGDRTSLDLPKAEEDLLKAVQATGKPLVVVLMNGSALAVNWANENANAIVEAWYSGEEGGTAIAESLAGVNNPAGRLPVTFYKGVEQLPPFDDYSMKNRTYRYFEGEPLYPFGYGLSYSKFAYANLKLSATTLSAGDSIDVDADVKNASEREGDEVVELYLSFPKSAGAPRHALRGMTRLHLGAGETRHLHFTLDARDLSEVNSQGDRIVAAGAHRVYLGGGQPETRAAGVEAEFSVSGEQRLPE